MTVAPAADTEIVQGVIQGIVQKGADKWQVEVNVGQQNPRRLWTKDAALVQQLSMMIGQHQSFLCGKSHWTNNSGQPVTSLWINGVGQGAAVPQAAMPQQPVAPPPTAPQPWPQQQPMMQPPMPVQAQMPQPQPTVQMHAPRLSDEERELRIMRQTATKVGSILISHVPAEQRTLDNVLALSERLVGYYMRGLQGQEMQGQNPGYDGDPGPQGIPQTDDDIPF